MLLFRALALLIATACSPGQPSPQPQPKEIPQPAEAQPAAVAPGSGVAAGARRLQVSAVDDPSDSVGISRRYVVQWSDGKEVTDAPPCLGRTSGDNCAVSTASVAPDGNSVAYVDGMALMLFRVGQPPVRLMSFDNGMEGHSELAWSKGGHLAIVTVNQDVYSHRTRVHALVLNNGNVAAKKRFDVGVQMECGATCVATTPIWKSDSEVTYEEGASDGEWNSLRIDK